MAQRNLLLKLSFLGTNYHGFQIQSNALTVQEVFQRALEKTLGGVRPDIKACSRTDAGVHANEFCVSFHTGSDIETKKLRSALNYYLPGDVRVVCVKETGADFHARYDCIAKRYRYLVYNNRVMDPFLEGRAFRVTRRIDETELDRAAQYFVGRHDFLPFSGSKRVKGDTERTVYSFSVARSGDLVTFLVTADGFLYNMARIMVGALLGVAGGSMQAREIPEILTSKRRGKRCCTAPAEGLYLDRVYYEAGGDHVKPR